MANLWGNKNILITGFEGFLGSNLTRKILSYEANVIGLDVKVNRKKTLLTKDNYRKMTVIKGSADNYKLVKEILQNYKIKIVFHLAAEAIVGRSFKKPLKTFSSNIKGTWNVLESCRQKNNIEAIIIASSDKAYGSHNKLPYKEDAALCGSHPYDVSKSCADLIAHTYYHTYNLPVAITRCGNIYGPGGFNFSRIVPDAIRCALSNKPLFMRSDGKFTRDYIYVDDIVNGYLLLAEQLKKNRLAGEAFNFSNENPISVIELVKKIYQLCELRPNYRILNQAKYEIKRQYLAASKAIKILGWEPKYNLEEGLIKTIAWYKKYIKKAL